MLKLIARGLAGAALAAVLALGAIPAWGQAAPTPQPVSIVNSSITETATTSTAAYQLSGNTIPSLIAVELCNAGTNDVYYALGGSSITATSSSKRLIAGTCIADWSGPNEYIALLSASSTSAVTIYHTNGSVPIGPSGSSSGGGGGGGAYKNVSVIPIVQNASYTAGQSLGGLQTISVLSSGLLQQVQLASKGGSTVGAWVYIWNKIPSGTTCTDRANFVVSQTNNQNLVAQPFQLLPALGVSTNDATTYAQQSNMAAPFVNNDTSPGTNLYVCLLAAGTVTPASTTDYRLNLQAVQ